MNQLQLAMFVIAMIAQYGLPAIDEIVTIVQKYGSADQVPEDDWKALFARARSKTYWDYIEAAKLKE